MNCPAVKPQGIKESDICVVIPACRESFRTMLDKPALDKPE
jgi:hypothetical protein